MDSIFHGVSKSQTGLSDFHFRTFTSLLGGQQECKIDFWILESSASEKWDPGNSLLVQWLGLYASLLEAWVRSLVWEVRSPKPRSIAKKH